MRPSDLDFATECTESVGWFKETREEFEGFLANDASDGFVAEVDGQRAGICVATSYGKSGSIGELIVQREARGRGIGTSLIGHAIEHLRGRGAENVLLDATPTAVQLYERLGFRKVCRSLRFRGTISGKRHAQVRTMKREDMDAVSTLDLMEFGGSRRFFLERRLSLYPEYCSVMGRDGQIEGYLMGRCRQDTVWVGPWVVQRGVEHPEHMLESLAAGSDAPTIAMGVLETSPESLKTLRSLGFQEYEEPSWRMVMGPSGKLGSSDQLYAIGSTAKD
jgi:ribosomal protein S18 acetylase RimI-like enzyme